MMQKSCKRIVQTARVVPLRRVIQAGFVGFALFVGARHLWLGSGPTGAPSFDAYCPFGGIVTLWQFITAGVFLRKLHLSNLVVLAATLTTAVLMGRAFCGWICPLGSVQEWLARLAQKLTGGRKAWLPTRNPRRPPMAFAPTAGRVVATRWVATAGADLGIAAQCPLSWPTRWG